MAVARSSSISPSASPVPSATSRASTSPSTAPPEPSIEERVSAAFERLSASAAALNVVSDELSKPIAAIDAALKTLNLGVTTWVEFAGSVDHNAGCFWERSLGYAKVSGKWGIAIRTMAGDIGDEPDEEYWPFGEAPRAYRLEAADKLPELIENLVSAAEETAQKLKEKIDTTNQVARAITQSPASVKEAFLAEVRKAKVVFFDTVLKQARTIELKNDQLLLRFVESQARLAEIAERDRAWLEDLAQRVGGRKITVSIDVIAPSGSRPPC